MDMPVNNPNLSNPNVGPAGPSPELPAPGTAEQRTVPTPAETASSAPSSTPPPAAAPTPPPVQDPMALALAQATPGTPQPVSGTPNVASDVDVIEPEWVDKAEEVVEAHRGDPYGEEEAIEQLQIEYLQKRYGFSVKKPDADGSKPGAA
jgi:hypothetical protein